MSITANATNATRWCYRYGRVVTLLFLLIAFPVAVHAQHRPVVQLNELENVSGQAQLDALGTAIIDGIALTLQLLNRYEVQVTQQPADIAYDLDTLRERARADQVDNLIFGEISLSESGGYLVRISAFDRGLNEIIYEDSVEFVSLFDAFDVVDEISRSMIEGFSGIRLTFGNLEIEATVEGTSDVSGPFSIRVNEVDLPSGTQRIDRIPAGEHRVVIRQERPLELWEYSETITVAADQVTRVSFALPELTPAELSVLDAGIARWQMRLLSVSEESFGETADTPIAIAQELLESSFFRDYRPALTEHYLQRFAGTGTSMIDSQPESTRSVKLQSGILDHWIDPSVAVSFGRSVPLMRTISGEAIKPEDSPDATNSAIIPVYRRINIDGVDTDWDGVPTWVDPTGDTVSGIVDDLSASDLVEFRAAYDHEYLYLMYRTQDRLYRRNRLKYAFYFQGTNGYWGWVRFSPSDTGIDRVGAGYDRPMRSEPVEWNLIRSGTRIAYSESFPQTVLEAAIPLEVLADWDNFQPRLTSPRIRVSYEMSHYLETLDRLDGVSAFIVPTRGLMLAD